MYFCSVSEALSPSKISELRFWGHTSTLIPFSSNDV